MITKKEILAGRDNEREARNPYREEIILTQGIEVTALRLTENAIDRLLFESYVPDRSGGIAFPVALQFEPDVENICESYTLGGWTVNYNAGEGFLYFSWEQNEVSTRCAGRDNRTILLTV